MMSEAYFSAALGAHVASRRLATGEKFATCGLMRPVFAELDAAGWNDWPPAGETISCRRETAETISVETISSPVRRETIFRRRRGRPRRGDAKRGR
jgi:hypothetical protein